MKKFLKQLFLLGGSVLLLSIPTASSTQPLATAERLLSKSQSARYGVDIWREAEGLPQSRIRAVLQTRDGYLWLGTDNGVVRFNGASFTTFTVETGSLQDNEVWDLQEDNEGALWIGTYGGLTRLKNGRFTTFTKADGLPDNVTTILDKDREGNIWIGTAKGAARYAQGQFTKFDAHDGLAENAIAAICADSPHGVFIAAGTRLHRFVNGTFQPIAGIATEGDGRIEHLLGARDGSLWIGFHNAVLKRWKDGVLTTYTRRHNLTPHIYRLHEDGEGTLWVSLPQGLYQLQNGQFEPVSLGERGKELGVIASLYTDREGSLWMGLEANGLARLHIRRFRTIGAEDGLPNDSTRTVFQDHRGAIWIGTVEGLTKYQHGRTETFTELNGTRLGVVRSIAEDAEGTLWVSASHGLLQMKEGRLAKAPGWHGTTDIKVLYRDGKGRIWVGTDGEGLFCYENGKVQVFRTSDGLASNQIRSLLYDRTGTLWIGTAGGGVSRFDGTGFKTLTTEQGLASSRVLAIHEDTEGTLWFATREGLSRYRDGHFFNFTAQAGLLTSYVYCILDDGRGNFWFSCAQGVFRVSQADLKAYADGKLSKVTSFDYGINDGMKVRTGNPGNQPTAWRATDGSLLFCTLQGVVIADPQNTAATVLVPPVYIEQVLINKQPQPSAGETILPVGAGEIEIHFAALSYIAPERMRYQYKLVGYNQDWVDAGTRRFAYYANLAPGRYRFQVRASNLDGPWNEADTSVAFYLQPRFYQTQLFYVLLAVALLLATGFLYRLRLHGLKARYSAVLAERNRIAGEIHDTLAQNLAGIALQLDSVTMQLADIPSGLRERLDQACNLTRYSLSEARRAVTDLRSDDLEQRELAEALPAIAGQLTALAPLQTSIEVTGTPHKLTPMTEKNLLRIYQEAVANAVKHAHAQHLEIALHYGVERLALRVRDDGCGFDTSQIIPLGVGHYGLTGMRERAERIGGQLSLKSQAGEGTELLVEAPYSA